MLEIDQLHAGYGPSRVLHGVSCTVLPGQIVALLGGNGAGRSTLAKAIMGLVDWQGVLRWQGQSLQGKQTCDIAHLGIGYVPESRDVFPRLTVAQNLLLGQKSHKSARKQRSNGNGKRWTLADMYQMFPRLHERQHTAAGVLSGGEQQMLTLCRTLMGNPQLVLIDEPTEGLAPKLVELVGSYVQALKARGIAVLLIEQKLTIALAVSDRVLVMGRGRIVFDGTPAQLQANPLLRQEWLEV